MRLNFAIRPTVLIVLFIFSFSTNTYAFFSHSSFTLSAKKAIEKSLKGKTLTIVPQPNKVSGGFSIINDDKFYYVKTISRIFFQNKDIQANIIELDFKDNNIEVFLKNDILGTGKITYFFNEDQVKKYRPEKFCKAILHSISSEHLRKFVCDLEKKVCHVYSSNHLPLKGNRSILTPSQAEAQGFTKCGFCFKKEIYLPGNEIEKVIAKELAGSLRYFQPLHIDLARQMKVQKTGENILSHWPIKLLGYDYSFKIVDSHEFNAYAIPGGQVFITNSLLNSLSDDLELEAILAHEIAHVERRHALQQIKLEAKTAQDQAALAAFGAILVGAAAASSNNDSRMATLTTAYGLATLAAATAVDMVKTGYSKSLELEADMLSLLYFQKQGKSKDSLIEIFKKMEYLNLIKNNNPDPDSDTHPPIKDRMQSIDEHVIVEMNKSYITSHKKNGMIQLDLLFHIDSQDMVAFYVYLNDYKTISKYLKSYHFDTKLVCKDKNKDIELSLRRNFITRDSWGAFLIFEGKGPNTIASAFTKASEIKIVIHDTNKTADYGNLTKVPAVEIKFEEGKISF